MAEQPASTTFAIEGEIVACPFCEAELYRLRHDLIYGLSPVAAREFEPINGSPAMVDGAPNPCPKCGADWFSSWYAALNRGEFSAVKRVNTLA